MPIIEKVSWDYAGAEDIAYRFPKTNLKFGSQVVVKENQWGIFSGTERPMTFLDLEDTR